MQFHIHQTFNPELQAGWDNLLDESHFITPFLKFGYLKQWWQGKGGGEWDEGKLILITATQADKAVGIAPFFLSNFEGMQSLLFVGSIEISDYLDFIAKPAHLQEFIKGMMHFLTTAEVEWQRCVLYNLLDNSSSIPVLQETAAAQGYVCEVEPLIKAPYIPLPESWDAYLAGIDKKQRHEIRRKLRRAEELAADIDWVISHPAHHLNADMDTFLRLMAQDKAKAKFLTEAMKTQMQQSIQWAAQEALLHLSFLYINGEAASGYYCFDYNNQLLVYNSGFDARFWDYSPGWVHLSKLIQWAIENKREVVDMMRGGETYKYRFGGVDRQVMRVIISKK